MRMKEYWDTCEKGMMERLAVVERVGELLCHQLRGDVSAGQGQETRRLLLKEALNIQVTPAEEHFNQVPRLLMWRQVGRVFRTFFAFALTITKVFN